MSANPQASLITGERLHLHHGPIDLIIGVEGPERQACFTAAAERFQTVLTELTRELPDLRRPLSPQQHFVHPVANRMAQAVRPFGNVFVTPMAAVAGAVADEVLSAMVVCQRPAKAYVNNGGDIALHLSGQTSFSIRGPAGDIALRAKDKARGVATSGWRGRSHSLGIADAVTVLARTAAQADVAATLIANAVDLPDHPGITRVPASGLNPDSDLGDRLVTAHVGPLSLCDIQRALAAGLHMADQFAKHGHIDSVVLSLQGHIQTHSAHHPIGAPAHA